jgi:hypothetical protein
VRAVGSQGDRSHPCFVAYAYPGWHRSPSRPGVDEWSLLDRFQPYFEGHLPPPRPLHGPYDDSLPETARRHVDLARRHGISAFSYFLYSRGGRLLLSSPLYQALRAASACPDFAVAATWCVRLPISEFPIPAGAGEPPHPSDPAPDPTTDLAPEDKPLELLTPADLEALLGGTAGLL